MNRSNLNKTDTTVPSPLSSPPPRAYSEWPAFAVFFGALFVLVMVLLFLWGTRAMPLIDDYLERVFTEGMATGAQFCAGGKR
ncbi:hypothetical protein [Variovorax sp.]|uniref:hypothetical protein n=1 Tax=Variovorax sp. TaxID=1871043 RepID=UPI003BAD7B1E